LYLFTILLLYMWFEHPSHMHRDFSFVSSKPVCGSDEHGEVIKHKAHMVAKGYVQRQGVNFKDVFAPVARMESVTMCLASHFD
jgi:hypothetical protein